LYIVNSR